MDNLPYKTGDIVRFRLKAEYSSNVELVDDYGNTTYVTRLKNTLKKGQAVDCRICQIKNGRPLVEPLGIVKDAGGTWSVSRERLQTLMGVESVHVSGFISLVLSASSGTQFESEVHRWAAHLVRQNAPLAELRGHISRFLEYSTFLDECKESERQIFVERITFVIELTGYYIKAMEIMNSDDNGTVADSFIDDIYRKLSVSGYVYHPRKNISLLMCLFSLSSGLMHKHIGKFLDLVRARDVSFWQKESYYQLLVKVLELYINETDALIDRKLNQSDYIHGIFQALAVVLLLGRVCDGGVGVNINRSRLFRYASMLNRTGSDSLLQLGWHNLVGWTGMPVYNIQQTSDVKVLAAILSNNRLQKTVSTGPLAFRKRSVRFNITSDGQMTLQPDIQGAAMRQVLPQWLMPWHDMNILLPDSLDMSLQPGCDDIFKFRQLWSEIELALFNHDYSGGVKNRPARHVGLDAGDGVNIYVTHEDREKRGCFHFRVASGIDSGAKGTLTVYPDAVGYRPGVTIGSFLSNEGRPLILPATVKAVCPDGTYVFSMRAQTYRHQTDSVAYESRLVCSIGSFSSDLGRYSAVSRDGFSISIPYEKDMPRLHQFDVIEVCDINSSLMPNYLDARFDRLVDEEFSIQDAFHQLMLNMSCGEYVELSTQVEDVSDCQTLDAPLVTEIMRLVDRQAAESSDYIQSYNYLGFARMLAMMLGNEERIRFYKGRMDLLALLHDFAVNDRVDEEHLLQLEQDNGELFSNNILMNRRFQQLKVIGYIGRTENNAILWQMTGEGEKCLRDLASLVLSYNLLKEQGLDRQSTEVHAHIKTMLHLKSRQSHLKNYGEEDLHTEFKTSIVYPAGGMIPNISAQTGAVMDVVAAMLNTDGGRIYLGVNDSGVGVGIEDDLKYPEFSYDKDKYIRHITGAVTAAFGKMVAPCVTVHFDSENNLPVCVLDIKPWPGGVVRDGKWFVRVNTRRVTYTENEYKRYTALHHKSSAVDTVPEADNIPVQQVKDTGTKSPVADAHTIPTAVYRYKLHEERYDGQGYINLKDDGVYIYSDIPMGGVHLSHEIYPEDDVLVIVYAKGHMNVVPVPEITEKQVGHEYIGVKGWRIDFAALAGKNDFVYLHYKVKGKAHVRVVPVQQWGTSVMGDTGRAIAVDAVDEIIDCEIIPAGIAGGFRLTRGAGGNGCPVSHKDAQNIINKIKLLKM